MPYELRRLAFVLAVLFAVIAAAVLVTALATLTPSGLAISPDKYMWVPIFG